MGSRVHGLRVSGSTRTSAGAPRPPLADVLGPPSVGGRPCPPPSPFRRVPLEPLPCPPLAAQLAAASDRSDARPPPSAACSFDISCAGWIFPETRAPPPPPPGRAGLLAVVEMDEFARRSDISCPGRILPVSVKRGRPISGCDNRGVDLPPALKGGANRHFQLP